MLFASLRSHGPKGMLVEVHAQISEADVVVHYNGTKFDMPWLNQSFQEAGIKPPSPVIELDLLKTARKRFRLPSNKLEYVARFLKVGKKYAHPGMGMWIGCMDGDESSWLLMESYNKQDVLLLEKVYHKLLPWIHNHPNSGLFEAGYARVCPNCGSFNLQRRGLSYTKTMTYQRYHCQNCGSWSRSRMNNTPKGKKENILVTVT